MSEEQGFRKYPVGLIVACVAAVAAVALGGLKFLQTHQKSQEREAEHYLLTIAQQKEAQLAAWIRDQKEDALALQESLIFAAHAYSVLESPESPVSKTLENFVHYVAVSHEVDDVLLVDLAGRVRFSLRGTQEIHAEGQAALAEAMRNVRPVMTDIHADPRTGDGCVGVAIPVKVPLSDPPRAAGGALLVTKASRFMDPLMESWPVPSRTGEALLVRREGENVLYLNALRSRPDSALKLRVPLSRADLPEVMAARGQTGVVRGTDERGVPVTAAIVPVEGTSWFLVAKVDRAELDEDNRILSVSMGLHWIGFAALLVFVVIWARQRARKEQFRRLFQAESELRKTLVRHAVVLEAMEDAVIVTDARGFVELCNPAAERLTCWTAGEAKGKPLKDVFPIEGEPGKEIVQDPVSFVRARVREGSFRDTVVLRTRDGRRKPVSVSVSLLREASGTVTGAILCCRDQSEEFVRRRILEIRLGFMERSHAVPLEEALSETLDAVGDLLESPVGFYASIAPNGEGIEARFGSSGAARGFCPGGAQKGHESLEKDGLWAQAAQEKRPIILNDDAEGALRGRLPQGHGPVQRIIVVPVVRDGTARALLALANKETAYTDEDAATLGLVADMIQQVVEHRQAEERLRQSEARYKSLFRDHKAVKLLIDPEDGSIVDANQAAVEF